MQQSNSHQTSQHVDLDIDPCAALASGMIDGLNDDDDGTCFPHGLIFAIKTTEVGARMTIPASQQTSFPVCG